jgi:nucleoside 2-deoxyribosyltransferase
MKKRIYLCGPIAHTDWQTSARGWREYVHDRLSEFDVFSPMRGKDFAKGWGTISPGQHKHPLATDQAIVSRDTHDVRTSDLLFANFLDCPPKASIGSSAEYGLAWAWRKPIVTVMEPGNVHDHPFIRAMSTYLVTTLDEAIDYTRLLLSPGL